MPTAVSLNRLPRNSCCMPLGITMVNSAQQITTAGNTTTNRKSLAVILKMASRTLNLKNA